MSQLMFITQVMININHAQDANSDHVALPDPIAVSGNIDLPQNADFEIIDPFKERD